ncbi:MAG: cytochrome P450 [Ginsengibacter sp.]
MRNPVQVINNRFLLRNTRAILKDPVDFLGKLAQSKMPMVVTNFVGKKYFVLQHPNYIKHVLVENQKAYYKPGATNLLRYFLGEGLSTSNGELWRRQRRIMQPAFYKQRLLPIHNVINQETSAFIKRLHSLPAETRINITHEFLQLTILIICRAMFSSALDNKMELMLNTLDQLAGYASKWMKSIIKFPAYWPTPANISFKNNCKVFDEIIYEIINTRRRDIANTDLPPCDDLLNMLMCYFDEDTPDGLFEKQLRDEITTIFMAGHETTAQTLSWIFYHLAKEKHLQHKIREEGERFLKDRLPVFEDLSHLGYTRQVINEALRMYPPIWAIVRKPLSTDEIDGIQIPSMSNVLINVYGIHHHPDYWDTPNSFNPNHFDLQAEQQRPQFAYLPFGVGSRHCLGSNFAIMVMQVVVTRLSQHFEFDVPGNYTPKVEPNITLRAKDGIQLIIKKKG